MYAAYATFYPLDSTGTGFAEHERAVVDVLVAQTPPQPWWLGYLETGAHDIVFPAAPRVPLYWRWPYVLVEAGPEEALTWRTGHMRGEGSLPDLFFPRDRSWLVSALWDDLWTDVGGSAALIAALRRDPLVNARPVVRTEEPRLVRGGQPVRRRRRVAQQLGAVDVQRGGPAVVDHRDVEPLVGPHLVAPVGGDAVLVEREDRPLQRHPVRHAQRGDRLGRVAAGLAGVAPAPNRLTMLIHAWLVARTSAGSLTNASIV